MLDNNQLICATLQKYLHIPKVILKLNVFTFLLRRTINIVQDQPVTLGKEERITLLSHLTNIEKQSGDTLMTNEPHRYISHFNILTVTVWEQRCVDDIAGNIPKFNHSFVLY